MMQVSHTRHVNVQEHPGVNGLAAWAAFLQRKGCVLIARDTEHGRSTCPSTSAPALVPQHYYPSTTAPALLPQHPGPPGDTLGWSSVTAAERGLLRAHLHRGGGLC